MYERILVPLDGSKVAESVLPHVEDLLSKLAPGLKAEITLLQVLAPTYHIVAGEADAPVPYTGEEIEQIKKQSLVYLDRIGDGLKSKGAMVETRVTVGSAADEILRNADEIDASLVAMSTHGRSGLSRWAFGSVADRVLRGGNRPVLLVRAPQDQQNIT